MKKLYLLRHAEAEMPAFEEDLNRKLSLEGRSQMAKLGAHMQAHNMSPDIIICSSSVRTSESADILVTCLDKKPLIEATKKLYLARTGHVLAQIWHIDERYKSAMIIGHNPGLHELAYALPINRTQPNALKIQGNFPPAALAIFEFPYDTWGEADYSEGTVLDVIFPADLKQQDG
jgi:phosphohistidine phosphatase